ncbi:hypothetical protein GYMLUDRAFT_80457 [Collybiopsis luxurians FD-317 M1]|nr:hypothetical protein GYMLUDRAFT_80457 [Collybiopsis luxurians FD-317 M1]
MSTDATDSTATPKSNAAKPVDASPNAKGKGKAPKEDQSMEVEDDDDDDDDEDSEEDSDEGSEEEDEDDSMVEIDPSAIVPRRTRGVKVDYTSEEALKKAGLDKEKNAEDDEDEEMKEN